VPPAADTSQHVMRARRTAAAARAVLAAGGVALGATDRTLTAHPWLSVTGFVIIVATAVVQLLVARTDLLWIEESLAPAAGILIVGLAEQRVTVLSVLWLAAVASGVLARGGRVH